MGNILFRRYLQDTTWVRQSNAAPERFDAVLETFKRYGDQYDFNWLFLAAQGYQESKLDQSLKSDHGAVGIMQLLPTTASSVGFDDITTAEDNIHAAAKYMRLIVDTYLPVDSLDPVNLHLFALAAYNGGPTRFRRLRRQAAAAGLDPNVWFDNVEVIAAREVGRENVQYVSNIYKYYVAYQMLADLHEQGLIDVGDG